MFALLRRALALVLFAVAASTWFYFGKTCGKPAAQQKPVTTHLNGATRGAMLQDCSGSGEPPPLGGLHGHVALAVEAENLVSLVGWHMYMADHAIFAIDSTSCASGAIEGATSIYYFCVQPVEEYQPAVGGRFANMLRNILNPKQWQSSVDFRESLISWDNTVLEQQSMEKISEALKIAIILEHAPTRIAESLRLSGPDVRDNYPAMRDAMRCLYESTREYPTSQTYAADLNGNGSAPMDVSAVLYGRGKKGRGKNGREKEGNTKDDKSGKGRLATEKFDGECGYCGKWGHRRADGRKKTYDEKDNGKGASAGQVQSRIHI